MLAYAANTRPAGRAGSPRALVLILAGHAVLIGAVMTARMDLAGPVIPPRTTIFNVPVEPPPPPAPRPAEPRNPTNSTIDRTPTQVDLPPTNPGIALDPGPIFDPGPIAGTGGGSVIALDPPGPLPVRIGPRFATPQGALKPPYPAAKLRSEEEATLRLRLSIDTRGRVVAVEPVGAADPEFLVAARRHILRAWRYQPASEDGVAVASSTVITLSFRLDDA